VRTANVLALDEDVGHGALAGLLGLRADFSDEAAEARASLAHEVVLELVAVVLLVELDDLEVRVAQVQTAEGGLGLGAVRAVAADMLSKTARQRLEWWRTSCLPQLPKVSGLSCSGGDSDSQTLWLSMALSMSAVL
jgi:hypothetical protein